VKQRAEIVEPVEVAPSQRTKVPVRKGNVEAEKRWEDYHGDSE